MVNYIFALDCGARCCIVLGGPGLYWPYWAGGLYWAALGLWAVLGGTWLYWAVLGCTGRYRAVVSCTGLPRK